RGSPPCGRPLFQIRKLNRENCRLYFVEAKIASNNMMKIARSHSVFSESAQPLRQLFISANAHAGIAGSSKILGTIKAKQPNFAHRSGLGDFLREWKFCTDCLGRVFDQN